MDYFEAKINQLVLEKPGKQKTFIRTFATKPDREALKKFGKIFGLIEIDSADQKIPELIDLIISEIKDGYYGQKNPAQIPGKVLALNDRFEAALKKTNLLITSFLQSEQLALNLEKINVFLGLACGQDLHFTVLGKVGVILFYNLGPGNYRIINILENTATPLSTPDPLKLFYQIISGQIRPHDLLFAGTANILDYFSLEKIKNLAGKYRPAESLAELKKLLAETNGKENFGAVILEINPIADFARPELAHRLKEFNYRQAASHDSMKELIKTEQATAKLLTPKILPEFKNFFGSLGQDYFDKIKSKTVNVYQKRKNAMAPKFSLPKIPRPQMPSLKINLPVFSKIKTGLTKISTLTILLFKNFFNKFNNQPLWQKIIFLVRGLTFRLLFRYRQLPKSSQRLLLAVIILVILFAQSVTWLGVKNNREKKIEEINRIIFAAENQKNDAESSLIYRDENQARQLLIDAKKSLAGLKPTLPSQKDKLAAVSQEIEEQLLKLRHLAEIGEPARITNFQNLDNQAQIADFAVASGQTLYTQNHNNQTIYKVNLETRVISAVYSPTANPGKFILGAAVADNQAVFFNESMSAFLLDLSAETLKPIAVNISGGNKIADITFFKTWLYLLDNKNSQIYRYTKTESGFGNLNNWIKEEGISLAQAKSLAVDGSVYILLADGKILKLENGKTVEFKLNIVDPQFIAPNKIKTTEESQYLYVLDPPTKRLVVFDKNGQLVSQYISEAFNDLKDFTVFEKEKEIYFFNGSTILGVPAKHLK